MATLALALKEISIHLRVSDVRLLHKRYTATINTSHTASKNDCPLYLIHPKCLSLAS